jgi:hypothetical protein
MNLRRPLEDVSLRVKSVTTYEVSRKAQSYLKTGFNLRPGNDTRNARRATSLKKTSC